MDYKVSLDLFFSIVIFDLAGAVFHSDLAILRFTWQQIWFR